MEMNGEDVKTEFTCVEIVPDLEEMEAPSLSSLPSAFIVDRNEREIVFRFIEMVRNSPEIWDVTSLAYRDKVVRRRSFRKIGEELGWTYNDVVKKYNNLRTYYTKEIIKQKRGNYQSRWPYFTELDSFLRKTVHTRNTSNRPGAKRSKLLIHKTTINRLGNYDGIQLAAGLRKKRAALGIGGDSRLRNTFHSRVPASVGSTSSASSTPTMPSLSSLAPPASTSTEVPLVNIQHAALSMQPQQQAMQTPPSTSTLLSRQQREVVQSQQLHQHLRDSEPPPPRQPQLQQVQIPRQPQQQQQNQRQTGSIPTAVVNRTISKAQKIQSDLSTSSSSSSRDHMDSSDALFGKLVASQLAKIKEGRKKEQLKINLMQQILQSMFNADESS